MVTTWLSPFLKRICPECKEEWERSPYMIQGETLQNFLGEKEAICPNCNYEAFLKRYNTDKEFARKIDKALEEFCK